MYRFTVNGVEVECDTAEELRAALGLDIGGSRKASVKKKAAPRKKAAKRKAKRKTKKKASQTVQGSAASKSWAEARKEAERQGRMDVAKVRSELAAGKRK